MFGRSRSRAESSAGLGDWGGFSRSHDVTVGNSHLLGLAGGLGGGGLGRGVPLT